LLVFLFIIENTAHIPLKMSAIFYLNYSLLPYQILNASIFCYQGFYEVNVLLFFFALAAHLYDRVEGF